MKISRLPGPGKLSTGVFAGLLLVNSGFLAACSSYRSAETVRAVELPAASRGPYRVRVADVLDLKFFGIPTLDQTRQVGPDGEVSLLLVGRVRAAGQTLAGLTEALTAQYSRELVDPQLSVSVKEFSAMSVHVGGEVNKPGLVPYRGGMTLVQAVMDAGGFLSNARLSEVVLIRRGPEGGPVATVVDVQRVFRHADFSGDVPLAPTDVVYVPRSRIADVNNFMQHYVRANLPIEYFYLFRF